MVHRLSRRRFLALVPILAAAASSGATVRTDPLAAHRIGLGLRPGSGMPRDPEVRAARWRGLVTSFVHRGGRLVDLGPAYEAEFSGAVAALGEDACVSTTGPVPVEVQTAAQRLHFLPEDSTEATWEAARRWASAASGRGIGLHAEDPEHSASTARIILRRRPSAVRTSLSALEPESLEDVLPAAMEAGSRVIAIHPFGRGRNPSDFPVGSLPPEVAAFASDWPTAMLKWVLAQPGVTVAAPVTRRFRHLLASMDAADALTPDAGQCLALETSVAAFRATPGFGPPALIPEAGAGVVASAP